ncbi:protease FtsH subunit HflC [Desulfosoma caldarium]|uniref:Protein HflC n=2 Tax=Desulfosoma caldarium TaxID=610254 RepID=A0A3N1VKL2_9BACT|nr:protease FtsH subunit HflC [Desulfosoma caldarium]
MPQNLRIPVIVVAVVLGVLAAGSLFIVSETEQVVITQWGRPVGEPITRAGLHFKLPIIQKANFFEKRVLKWDGSPNQIPTRDKKYIWVDTTARWRIKDPLLFLQRVGNVSTALSRLDGIIDSVVRDHVSNNYLGELVRSEGWKRARESLIEAGLDDYQIILGEEGEADSEGLVALKKGREKITREMVADASRLLPEFGIELLDIRIKRINYVQSVQQRVFERMISERKRIAAQYRSEGEGERAAILGQMERDLARIQSEAYRTAEEIRGKADAQATRIYAETFGKNPEFYQFYQTLDFYKRYENPRGLFVLGTDAELFRYLQEREPEGVNP